MLYCVILLNSNLEDFKSFECVNKNISVKIVYVYVYTPLGDNFKEKKKV